MPSLVWRITFASALGLVREVRHGADGMHRPKNELVCSKQISVREPTLLLEIFVP
jgi:hypothetical protein